jgi:hypothetical protein
MDARRPPARGIERFDYTSFSFAKIGVDECNADLSPTDLWQDD